MTAQQPEPTCPICAHPAHTGRLSCEVKVGRGGCICRGPVGERRRGSMWSVGP